MDVKNRIQSLGFNQRKTLMVFLLKISKHYCLEIDFKNQIFDFGGK